MKAKSKISGMISKGFKADRCKTVLKLAMARLKLMRNKREIAAKQMRRDVAQLLKTGQDQTARTRVEHVIREEKTMAAYELIELYCELLVARMTMIESEKYCPVDLKEAISSLIFASARCADIEELSEARKLFSAKYGREFTAAALEVRPNSGVSSTVIEKLSANTPDTETKIKTLSAIAEEHNVEWEPKAFGEQLPVLNIVPSINCSPYSGGSSMESESCTASTYSERSSMESESSNASTLPARLDSRSTNASEVKVVGKSSDINTFPGTSAPTSQISLPASSYVDPKASAKTTFEEKENYMERKSSWNRSGFNMDFKDAASAAHAAAESAEMASFAARAAAELAGKGNFSEKFTSETYRPSGYDDDRSKVKDERRASVVQEGKRDAGKSNLDRNDSKPKQFNGQNLTKKEASSLPFGHESLVNLSASRPHTDNKPPVRDPYGDQEEEEELEELEGQEGHHWKTDSDWHHGLHDNRFSDAGVSEYVQKSKDEGDRTAAASIPIWDDQEDIDLTDYSHATFDHFNHNGQSVFQTDGKDDLLHSLSQQSNEPSGFSSRPSSLSSKNLISKSQISFEDHGSSSLFKEPGSMDSDQVHYDSDGLGSENEINMDNKNRSFKARDRIEKNLQVMGGISNLQEEPESRKFSDLREEVKSTKSPPSSGASDLADYGNENVSILNYGGSFAGLKNRRNQHPTYIPTSPRVDGQRHETPMASLGFISTQRNIDEDDNDKAETKRPAIVSKRTLRNQFPKQSSADESFHTSESVDANVGSNTSKVNKNTSSGAVEIADLYSPVRPRRSAFGGLEYERHENSSHTAREPSSRRKKAGHLDQVESDTTQNIGRTVFRKEAAKLQSEEESLTAVESFALDTKFPKQRKSTSIAATDVFSSPSREDDWHEQFNEQPYAPGKSISPIENVYSGHDGFEEELKPLQIHGRRTPDIKHSRKTWETNPKRSILFGTFDPSVNRPTYEDDEPGKTDHSIPDEANTPKSPSIRSQPSGKSVQTEASMPRGNTKNIESSHENNSGSSASSSQRAPHVHPKLPDYDSFTAHFLSLRKT